MNGFLLGATSLAYACVGLFFLRYWRRSGDRLFVMFAIAFGVLAANRIAFAVYAGHAESQTLLYVVRFIAFACVLVAIVDKNRAEGGSVRPQE